MCSSVPPLPFASELPRDQLSVEFRLPDQGLRSVVSGYNFYGLFGEGYESRELYMPALTGIRFNWSDSPWSGRYNDGVLQKLGPAVLLGPSTRNMQIETPPNGISLGLSLTPLGLEAVLGLRADRLAGKVIDLSTTWPDAMDIRSRILQLHSIDEVARFFDSLVMERIGPISTDAPVIEALMDLLLDHHDVDVTSVASHLGQSVSTLRRVSLRHFGFPLKVLLRRSRFMKSFVSIYGRPQGTWSALIDSSYHDQSHFIKDFRYFIGMSPSSFFSIPSPMTTLSMKARTRVLGAPVVALHRTKKD